ncbi:MAG: Gfo/Idh/MocA family oxidoreductase [Clostridiales bacterium]|jgi:predicted dehydrogenase|nr:Gfo/Idh/MocA family oxidoreductase [Clostridiales bacterium]
MLKCGIIGFGGLGKVHFKNLSKMEEEGLGVKVAALCDVEESKFTARTATNLGDGAAAADTSRCSLYADAREMLSREALDFAVIAVPTYLHERIAVAALEAGAHVFCEKPMARASAQAQNMLGKAKAAGRLLMIGQCLRYWPEYAKLKSLVESGEYGRVVRADFSRLSAPPKWSWQDWYLDYEKSGGAALDLHVHDIDMVNWLFGAPQSVSSEATHAICKFDSITTRYQYPGKLVTATADWGLAESFPFGMGFLVRFERATAAMGAQGLRVYGENGECAAEGSNGADAAGGAGSAGVAGGKGGKGSAVGATGGKDGADTAGGAGSAGSAAPHSELPALPTADAYYNELADFIRCINDGASITVNPPESSLLTLRIALAEQESANRGGAPVGIGA